MSDYFLSDTERPSMLHTQKYNTELTKIDYYVELCITGQRHDGVQTKSQVLQPRTAVSTWLFFIGTVPRVETKNRQPDWGPVVALFFAATPCWRDPTRWKQLLAVAMLGLAFSLQSTMSLFYLVVSHVSCADQIFDRSYVYRQLFSSAVPQRTSPY